MDYDYSMSHPGHTCLSQGFKGRSKGGHLWGLSFLPVHRVFLALTYVGTKDILSCTLPLPVPCPFIPALPLELHEAH